MHAPKVPFIKPESEIIPPPTTPDTAPATMREPKDAPARMSITLRKVADTAMAVAAHAPVMAALMSTCRRDMREKLMRK